MKDIIELSTFDFNKEIIIGEIGALIFIPLFSFIASLFTSSVNIISSMTIVGSIVGASIFWISTRIYDEKRIDIYSLSRIIKDVEYFTPAAFILTSLIYYPLIFAFSHYFLNKQDQVVYSVLGAQAIAFALFLAAINIYRFYLWKLAGKRI